MNRLPAWLWGVIFELGLGLVAVMVGSVVEIAPWRPLAVGRRPTALATGIVGTLPPLLFYAWARRTRWGPLVRLRQKVQRLVDDWLQPLGPLQMVALAWSAGVGEELLFRGLLQQGLQRWAGPTIGWASATTLFAFMHAVSPTYFVVAWLMGGYLGGLYLVTGSVITPLVVHSLYDWWVLWDVAGRKR